MKLSSIQLEAFFAVARTRNFTRAAKEIHVSQSALSQRILNLEQDIGTSLFIRERTGIELTSSGEELLRYCKLQQSFEAEFLGKFAPKKEMDFAGIIRIAGFSSVMRSIIQPSIYPLLLRNPKLQLQSTTLQMHQVLTALKSGEVDYVISESEVHREEIESIRLGTEKNVLVENGSYHGGEIYLDHDEKDEITYRYLKKLRKTKQPIKRHFMDDIYSMLDGVSHGLGRAVLPHHLVRKQKGLRILNPDITLDIPIYLHFYRQPFYTKLHEEIIKSLVTGSEKYLSG